MSDEPKESFLEALGKAAVSAVLVVGVLVAMFASCGALFRAFRWGAGF